MRQATILSFPARAAGGYSGQTRLAWPFLGPLLLAFGISTVLIGAIYARPFRRMQDVGMWAGLGSGLHEVEKAQGFSYVHTDGDGRVQLPEAGTGSLVVRVRLGGPGGITKTQAHLGTGGAALDLGAVEQIRVYHLVAPASAQGNVDLRIESPSLMLPDDPRPLGVLIDWIEVQSLEGRAPPLPLLGATVLFLALLAWAWSRIDTGARWLAAVLLPSAVVLGCAPLLYRGQVALAPWWLGLGLSAAGGMALAHAGRAPFPASPRGVVATFVAWRMALWLIAGLGLWWSDVVYRHGRGIASSFGKTIIGHEALLQRILGSAWMRWDSEHYQAIATTGYTFEGVPWPNIAFFPLYPIMIRLGTPLVGGSITIAALLISNLALMAALLLLYDLVARDFDQVVAYRSVLVLLLFPTSFYLVAGYTESLALALAVAAVWAMRRERWWLAGAAGFLLALTRVPGVLIAPVLACAYLQHHGWKWKMIFRPQFLAVFLPPLGLASFMLYQWLHFGTPFAFLIAQQSWNNGMAVPWVIPQKILRAARSSAEWEMAVIQLAVWLSFIGLAIIGLRRLPLTYGLTALLLLLPAFLANQRGSLIRHVLIGFPMFVVLALTARQLWVRWLVFSLMLPLLVVFTLMFVNGFGLA